MSEPQRGGTEWKLILNVVSKHADKCFPYCFLEIAENGHEAKYRRHDPTDDMASDYFIVREKYPSPTSI